MLRVGQEPSTSGIQPMSARTWRLWCTGSKPPIRIAPASGTKQRGQHEQQGGLAGTVRADQAGHLAGVGGEGDVAHGMNGAEGAGESRDDDAGPLVVVSHAMTVAGIAGRIRARMAP